MGGTLTGCRTRPAAGLRTAVVCGLVAAGMLLFTRPGCAQQDSGFAESLFETKAEPEAEEEPGGRKKWPDIKFPGPDLGDFPNSAFTLPKGRAYLEAAPFTLAGPDRFAPSSFVTPVLLRYGVTDDVEFRIFGSGVTHIFGHHPETGISPLAIDMKVHLWDEKKEWFVPASSLEVYLQTPWGSNDFNGGWQPSLNLNFDLGITKTTNLEWTVGYTGVQDAVNIVTGERFIARHNFLQPVIHRENLNINMVSVQWALEQDVTKTFQVFFHGFFNGAILFQQGAGITVGGGIMWQLSDRLVLFGSMNAGLTEALPPLLGQVGFAVAI